MTLITLNTHKARPAGWEVRQETGPQVLPSTIMSVLTSQFGLDPGHTGSLRILERPGHYARREVRWIKVFDAGLMEREDLSAQTFDNFLQVYSHRKALLFEGRIESDGAIHLNALPGDRLKAYQNGQILGPTGVG